MKNTFTTKEFITLQVFLFLLFYFLFFPIKVEKKIYITWRLFSIFSALLPSFVQGKSIYSLNVFLYRNFFSFYYVIVNICFYFTFLICYFHFSFDNGKTAEDKEKRRKKITISTLGKYKVIHMFLYSPQKKILFPFTIWRVLCTFRSTVWCRCFGRG